MRRSRGQLELKERRLAKGWSQGDLAAQVGVRIATICEWENDPGRRPHSYEHVEKVREVLGIPPEWWSSPGERRVDATS